MSNKSFAIKEIIFSYFLWTLKPLHHSYKKLSTSQSSIMFLFPDLIFMQTNSW